MSMSFGFRKHGRKIVKCAVKLSHEDLGDIVAETRDISESGVFVSCKDILKFLAVGDQVEASLYTDCEIVSHAVLHVVRMTDEGVGLSY